MGRSTHLSEMAQRSVEILLGRTIDQCGAICFRMNDIGAVEVLLITSRDTGRWVVPKGNIEKNGPLYKCARREALEEAGVIGCVGKKSIGYFSSLKDSSKPPFLVSVFALQVENAADEFKEAGIRKLVWVSPRSGGFGR